MGQVKKKIVFIKNLDMFKETYAKYFAVKGLIKSRGFQLFRFLKTH